MSTALDLLLLLTSWIHVLLAPYTKVEESFNLHATHDVLMYGVGPKHLRKYDHFVFPGAVPRTFIGSVLLAWLSTPVVHFARYLNLLTSKFDIQIIVRLVLASCNILVFSLLRRGISRRYGRTTGILFALITASQFHVPFWVGRTLPNMFALPFVNIAVYSLWKPAPNASRPTSRSITVAISLLTFTTVVFRSEVLLLLGPLVLQALFSGYITLWKVIEIGLVSGLVSIALTVAVDSYFWQQWPLWPELYGIYFNVFLGKSSEWGVSPFHTHFTSHLPKLLLTSAPLSVFGALIDSRIRTLLLPALSFVLLIGGLAHKEWRFIVYVVPFFNIAAARGASWLVGRPKGTLLGLICFFIVAGCLALNCLATVFFTVTSMANYPGGVALSKFNDAYAQQNRVHVHISNLAAQTGASLFLQTHAPPYPEGLNLEPTNAFWTYDKTEGLTPKQLTESKEITHVITEMDPDWIFSIYDQDTIETCNEKLTWNATVAIEGFERWEFQRRAIPTRPWDVLKMVRTEKLGIMERNRHS